MKNSNLKISFYTNSLSLGGAEKVGIYLATYFSSRGLDVSIVTNKIEKTEYALPIDDIERRSLQGKNETLNKFVISKRMFEYLRSEKPDVLVVLGTPLLSYLALPLLLLKTKIIVSERNSPKNFSGKKLTKFISNRLFKLADGYVFQTQGALSYYHWINSNKTVIPNPLFVDNIPNVNLNKKRKRKNTIVSIGRLHKQKNQKLLINAFALIEKKYPEYSLIIYGEGEERQSLERLIKTHKLTGRVLLPGATEKVLEEIKDTSLFVFSSDFEGMPNALIEAMSLGLPVISTDCPSGGPRDLITDGLNGLLTPVGATEKFAKKMDYILSHSKVATNLGLEAIKVREKLNAQKIGKKWLDFCLKVINNEL